MTKADKMEWHKECAYGYFWESVPGIGIKTMEGLYKKYGSYEEMYRTGGAGLKGRQREAFCLQKERWDVKEEYSGMIHNKIWCIPRYLCGYPDKLKEIYRPPSALFVKGKLPDKNRPAVAVVGARNCSPYGKAVAKEIGKVLAQNKIQVVSGLAKGVDGISQQAAVENGGASFGVMGCGADICYPAEQYPLYEQLSKGRCGGGILSEFMPGTKPLGGHFPLRNRIISGLADALVVVEAKEKSGTFITVSGALEQGRDIYAVPGRLGDALSCGCNRLIEEGAFLLHDLDRFVEDILERSAYGKSRESAEDTFWGDEAITEYKYEEKKEEMVLEGLEGRILEALDIQYVSAGDLLFALEDCPTSEVLAALSTLECCGKVKSEGSFYRKVI